MNPTRLLALGRWYAAPLDRDAALALRARSEERERERLQRGRSCFTCRVNLLIARYWLGDPVDDIYQTLAAHARTRHSPRARALLELIYGQLLAARRRPEAARHLEKGFAEGRNLLAPGDYFVVLKRHALLRLLPPDGDDTALDLEDLLTTARVIERMTRGRSSRPAMRHTPGTF